MMESFSLFNMLQEGYALKDRILFERISYGSENLPQLLDAIKSNRKISFEHSSSSLKDYHYIEGEPYCLKFDKQRWYVLLKSEDGNLQNYALDSRTRNIKLMEETFKLPEDFSAEEYYQFSYGIWVEKKILPEIVRIKVTDPAIKYLRSLPLHHSQTEKIIDDKTSIFQYYIKTDLEFKSELFKWGPMIQVLEPQELVDFMKEEARKILSRYQEE